METELAGIQRLNGYPEALFGIVGEVEAVLRLFYLAAEEQIGGVHVKP